MDAQAPKPKVVVNLFARLGSAFLVRNNPLLARKRGGLYGCCFLLLLPSGILPYCVYG